MDQVMGVVMCFAGYYTPRYWATCDGQALSISQNQALFSLLGTTYGGDGVNTFCLPDLRGRTAVSVGESVFRTYQLGNAAGAESLTLNIRQIPSHNHNGVIQLALGANSGPGVDPTVNDGYPAEYTGAYSATSGGFMQSPVYSNVAIGSTGSGLPIDTRSPFLAISHIISLAGIYPTRN
jgi:microcystin-dependent protein